ncbi:MAG: PhoH family protein, partial [Allobaculum sp.]|nr:PhoH family protein [Allobaculum sp.]
MVQEIDRHGFVELDEVERLCGLASKGHNAAEDFYDEKPIVRTRTGKVIVPKTKHQKELVQAFQNSKITFASGVAGTGKTYLAVAFAVSELKKEKISKIILTRPAVEAGESLGFLPGDMQEKVDPYLRPLYDALNEMLGQENVEKYREKGIIEIAPLAFMRGRTLNDAVVILDEAQNATKAQMKMFLTRMGKNCRMMVNGDIS